MKLNIIKSLFIFMGAYIALIFLTGCEPKKLDADENDIILPVIEIAECPTSGDLESVITITGSGFNGITENMIKNVPYRGVYFGNIQLLADDVTIISDNEMEVVVPRLALPAKIKLENVFSKLTESDSVFTPNYPASSVSSYNDTIFLKQKYYIQGTNLDLVTTVQVGKVTVELDRSKQTSNQIELDLSSETITSPASIQFTALSESTIPTLTGITVLSDYPWADVLNVFPSPAAQGSTVYFAFADADSSKMELITDIRFHFSNTSRDPLSAAFTIEAQDGYIEVTVPNDTVTGDFTIVNGYLSKRYNNMLTVQ